MAENKAVSDGTNETMNQTKQLAIRFAPEIVARLEADALVENVSPTEIVRSIVCKHYGESREQVASFREIRELIEDRFRQTVYEISRTRSSLYHMVEQSEVLELDHTKLEEIYRLSHEGAADYLGRLDVEIDRRKNQPRANK